MKKKHRQKAKCKKGITCVFLSTGKKNRTASLKNNMDVSARFSKDIDHLISWLSKVTHAVKCTVNMFCNLPSFCGLPYHFCLCNSGEGTLLRRSNIAHHLSHNPLSRKVTSAKMVSAKNIAQTTPIVGT